MAADFRTFDMKRVIVTLTFVLPALALGLWSVLPDSADPALVVPLFHFYIVVFTTFAATVLSLFVTFSVGQNALVRHLLLAMAFAWMGAMFFIHGITTSGAIIAHFHPAITWSAWLTLFGGGGLFLAGAFAPNTPHPRFLKTITLLTLTAYLAYMLVVLFASEILNDLLAPGLTPRVSDLAFGITLLLWLVSSGRHYLNYRKTRHPVDGLMAFEAGWFAIATVSMFRFELWHASWWLYHALLLIGFLVAIYVLARAYEQLRIFRLGRYYVATSLIVTAALALISAQLYAQLAFQSTQRQIEDNLAQLSQSFAAELAAAAPDVQTAADLVSLSSSATRAFKERIAAQPAIREVTVFNPEGLAVFTTAPTDPDYDTPIRLRGEELKNLSRALAGQTILELKEPGAALEGYGGASTLYTLQTYLPFRPAARPSAAPIGGLLVVRESPELTDSLIMARRTGLGLAALSMGGLFVALFVVVRRADHLIVQRTRELETAYTDLRKAEALRDDLTGMMVHDLRNPLTAVTANLDLISKTLNNPAYQESAPRFLASARGAGQRMIGMIDDLLNVSKLEAGELRPNLAPLQLPRLLAEREAAYRAQAEREEKIFAALIPDVLPALNADASLIGRTIDNLVSNAFKYTGRGGLVEIGLEKLEHVLVVHIRDDGDGVPPEYHQRIFDKFVQVTDDTGQPLRKGTGLGLAFCRLAVEAHGGVIWVESRPGQGSRFSFTLPLDGREE